MRIVQLLPGVYDDDDDDEDGDDDDSPPGQNKDIVFNEGGVEPEVERTLLVVLWHLLRIII